MQYQLSNSPHRNSYGFTFNDGFASRNANSKGFPVEGSKLTSPKQDDLGQKIQDLSHKN